MYWIFPILFIAGAVLQLINLSLEGKSSKKKYIGISLIVIGLAGSLIGFYQKLETSRRTATQGELISKINPKYRNLIVIRYGSSYSVNKINNSISNIKLPFEVATLLFSNNSLKISTKVRSLDNKIIGVIESNKWVLNPNNYFMRNYDNSALEVIDNYGTPVLQIQYLDSFDIIINGIFRTEHGYAIITEDGEISSSKPLKSNDTKALLKKYKKQIEPFFSYTGDYLGVRSDYGREILESYRDDLINFIAIQDKAPLLPNDLIRSELDGLIIEFKQFYKEMRAAEDLLIKAKKSNFEAKLDESSNAFKKLIIYYNKHIRNKAIVIRSEAYSRLPQKSKLLMRNNKLNIFSNQYIYIFPNNSLVVEELISDLTYIRESL